MEDKKEIENKAAGLENILSRYKSELSQLEEELFDAISDYKKALEEEKLKELRQSLEKS